MNDGEMRSVRIIYCIQTEISRHCSEMDNGEIWSVCFIYHIQTEIPRRCSEMNNGEIWFIRITYYKETDLSRHCSERNKARFGLSVSIYSGNEQRRDLGVCIYKLSLNLTYIQFLSTSW